MASVPGPSGPVRIGNCSGFYGDRHSAMREMLTGGALDYVTGDYLAELTMLILGRDRMKHPDRGYAKTFLTQLEECLGLGAPLTANAYLGAWGVVDCLASGADVVVTGRVTDASLTVGPAAAHFGWGRTDYRQLAGAVVAGLTSPVPQKLSI